MVEYFRMPKMTELMAAVTILQWYKPEGQEVKMGEAICQVETEKAVSDIESPSSGILRKIVAPNGSTVNPGDIIAMIGSSDEELPQIKPTSVSVSQEKFEESKKKMKIMISPRAKQKADQNGIDISTITGTGPGGKIIERDVTAAIKTINNCIKGMNLISLSPKYGAIRYVIIEKETDHNKNKILASFLINAIAVPIVASNKTG